MTEQKLIISPKTKIGELLQAYPELEPVLISISPMFEKLRNPVLRRTVARVATIQQVSVVGGIPVEQIINRLRQEVGQTEESDQQDSTESFSPSEPPEWFDEKKITLRYDASPVINTGDSPMSNVLQKSSSLKPGEIMELKTPFVPAPILDMLKGKKFQVWTTRKQESVFNYITRF
ncbi:MAG TPA: DUF1858 domain-containing protein [Bacteroidales bacterium]|nr:DUF1858 domain-containing protein [Bacteroidales bacterium]